MEKLLLIGIDTRSMLESALKLNYELYSVSYFSTQDTPQITNQKIILEEKNDTSCGNFKEKFNSQYMLDISKDYLNEVDYIIPISGISPTEIKKKYQKKIIGTKDIKNIENKYKFYKKIKNNYKTPKTYRINEISEAIEISKNEPNTKYILKPVKGSGGYNIHLLNKKDLELEDDEYIMQEYINGINLSSSILGSKNRKKTITNTRLLTEHDLKKNNNYRYIGNILPLNDNKINEKMAETSEKLGHEFNLIGSNGVDYILNKNGIYVIEINPRIQGTFECIEKSYNINMIDAHIKSTQGEIIEIPKAKCYTYKKIIYSPTRFKYKKIKLNNIYDIPHYGSITEKDEPLLTIIDQDVNLKKLCEKIKNSSQTIENIIKKHQQDAI